MSRRVEAQRGSLSYRGFQRFSSARYDMEAVGRLSFVFEARAGRQTVLKEEDS